MQNLWCILQCTLQYATLVKEKFGILHLPAKTAFIHIVLSYTFITVLGAVFVNTADMPFKNRKSCNTSLEEALFVNFLFTLRQMFSCLLTVVKI